MYKDAFDHTKDANQAEARFIINAQVNRCLMSL